MSIDINQTHVSVHRSFINNTTIHLITFTPVESPKNKRKTNVLRANRLTRVCEANSFRSDALLHACLAIELAEKGKMRSEAGDTRDDETNKKERVKEKRDKTLETRHSRKIYQARAFTNLPR